MAAKNYDISVFVMYEGKKYVLETYPHEYRNLMMLIYDKVFLENFGDCKGIGRCGTCHIHLVQYDGELLNREGNENTTLNKMPIVKPNSRLSCQVLVDQRIDGLTVEVIQDDDPGLY